MRQTLEYMKMAVQNILANKMRSLLTMLGIIIGISAVIMVLTVGGGGQKTMNDQFSSISKGEAYLMLSYENSTENDTFTDGDVKAIRAALSGLAGVTPTVSAGGTVSSTQKTVNANISATGEDGPAFSTSTMAAGRGWTAEDYLGARRVMTIDENGAKALFGSTNVVGMTAELTVGGRTGTFTIVGVTQSNSMNGYGATTAGISVPLSTLQSLSSDVDTRYYQLALLGVDKNDSLALANQAMQLVAVRHGNTDRQAYEVMDMQQFADQINTVTGMFTGIIAAVAAISLLVGGIGVMNIMLVSVTERTREIGIRKALGARTKAILFQFLVESGTITLMGGVIGILLGVSGGLGLSGLLGIEGYIAPGTVAAIALFSSVIGVFFGIYPAKKAAALSPIEALRAD